MRGFYPSDWREISRRVRFERAAGICQGCGRPHGMIHLLQLTEARGLQPIVFTEGR
jgi:hypothetical protein